MWDKDVFSDDDFIGKCVMPIENKTEEAKDLSSWDGGTTKAGGFMGMGKKASKLVVSVSKMDLPESSRLTNGTSTRVHRGENIPNMDASFVDHTDAFVEVNGLPKHLLDVTKHVQQAFRDIAHSTSLVKDSEAPVFEEEFKFATLREESKADFLAAVGIALGLDAPMEEEEMKSIFVSTKTELEKDSQGAAAKFAARCFPKLEVLPPKRGSTLEFLPPKRGGDA
jgi:hypothetical protein